MSQPTRNGFMTD